MVRVGPEASFCCPFLLHFISSAQGDAFIRMEAEGCLVAIPYLPIFKDGGWIKHIDSSMAA